MNWGTSIVVAFVAFALFIGVLVTVCVRQEVSLVSRDYYRDELNFSDHMKRVSNTQGLTNRPSISLSKDSLLITCPSGCTLENGKILLYSPADVKQDRSFTFEQLEPGDKKLFLGNLKRGKYSVQMNWSMNGTQYYYETVIFI